MKMIKNYKIRLVVSGITTVALLSIARASTECAKPTDGNNCSGNQTEMCSNGCENLEYATHKNKDCKGTGASKQCVGGTGSIGGTSTIYQMLDGAGTVVKEAKACSTCGSTVVSGPTAVSVDCRTAVEGGDCP